MKRIVLAVRKLLIILGTVFFTLFQRRLSEQSGEVLLVLIGGLGDSILEMQATSEIIRQLNSEGKHVTIIATKPNCEMYRMCMPQVEVRLLPHSVLTGAWFTREKLEDLRNAIQELRRTHWEQIIVRLHRIDIKGWLLTAPVPAGQKTAIQLFLDAPSSRKFQAINRLNKLNFDLIHNISAELNTMQFMREFAKLMGVASYPIKITSLPEQASKLSVTPPYITVTVDSSSASKRWPCERFIELIQKLLKEFSYNVVLTGVNVPEKEAYAYSATFRENERVIDMIGKTALKDWIELIRGAVFHVGVDSSSIHVAAAVGTQAFCLVGVWDGKLYYPYQIEKEEPGTAVPCLIYRNDVDINSLHCRNCNMRGITGWGNMECRARCKDNKPCLCLDRITVDDVMTAIEKAKHDGVI